MVIMARQRRFPVKWLVALFILAAALYWGPGLFNNGGNDANTQAAGAPVSVATVVSRSVRQWSEFSGLIEPVSVVQLRPRVGGQIMQVQFKDGSMVNNGQPLFLIDPRPYEAEVLRARGALAAAQSAGKNANQNLARARQLIRSKAISQSEFELRSSDSSQAVGNVDAARGALQAAQVNLEYTRIKAPISGKISRAEITRGNLVEAGPNAPLLASIVALSPLYISFDLDEKTFLNTIQGVAAAKLQTIPVEIGLANSEGTPIKAAIHSFDNQITAGSGTIRVRAVVPNKDYALVPGLFARVRIGTPEEEPAILINPVAVSTDQSKKFVLVVGEGNKAEYREVALGGMMDGLQIVRSGLEEGEQIVVNGLQRLRPGAEMQPQTVDMLTLKPVDAASGPAEADVAAPAS